MVEKRETLRFYRGNLPHWEVAGGRYFVTIRLSGSIPAEGILRITRLREQLEDFQGQLPSALKVRRQIFIEMEEWLHKAQLVNHLQNPEIASEVIQAIEHRENQNIWNVFSYVIMPNHIHLFFKLCSDSVSLEEREITLKKTLEGFKRWTAHRAKPILTGFDRRFWQREWFDHWSRSHEHDERFIRYIQENPVKAGLVSDKSAWPYTR